MTPLPRFMIAAAHKSSGKTVISTGLAGALANAGDTVTTFKKGPDYIDPMWLKAASGHPCYNLDFNTMDHDEIINLFASRAGSLSMVEANKGLFDGLRTDGSDSNAALAKLLGLPVILVIDTLGMTRGIAPLLTGYVGFDTEVNIVGVILNKVGGARHETKLRDAVQTYTQLPVLGSVWRDKRLEIGERHLGLTTPTDCLHKSDFIATAAEIVAQSVDLNAVRAAAKTAPDLPVPVTTGPAACTTQTKLRIGIFQDAAFGFYYPDDLEAFQAAGATLVPIDATGDKTLPDVDGLFIGGGFPECWMQALSDNTPLRSDVRRQLQNGMPCYAECGGLMYLCESLSWHGQCMPMVGLIKGHARMHSKPQGRGYVAFERSNIHPWGPSSGTARAHEFHYASIDNLPENKIVHKQVHGPTSPSHCQNQVPTKK